MTKSTRPEVFIVESLRFDDEDAGKEGEIIYRALRMSGKDPIYHYVRTRAELAHFIEVFRKSRYRYFHLSCHGNIDTFATTLDVLDGDALAGAFGDALDRKRLFLSTCLAAESGFARKIFEKSTCYSVAGPVGTIDFDDSAVLWTAFYHLMFKENPNAMKHESVLLNLSKAALVLDQELRVFTQGTGGKLRSHLLPPKTRRVTIADLR